MNTSFSDRDGWIWKDGGFVPWRDAKLHVLSHGLHYASSVFEGVRAYGGNIFRLTEHSARLKKSAELIGFEIPYSVDEIDRICMETVEKNGLGDAYIRPVAWRGSEMMAISAQKNTIHLAVAAWEWPSYFAKELREQGLKLQTSKWKRPSPETEPVHSKAAGLYMICTMSKHSAEAAGFHDALMHDWRGYVAECTGANIFFVMGGELHTPTPDCFLDGITRRTVMDLARNAGLKVVERHIKPEEIADADEIFITGTAAEVTPIGQIDDMKFTVGDVTKKLETAYMQLVRGN